MKNEHIATRGTSKLFYTHDSLMSGVSRRMGYVLMDDGSKIKGMVDSILSRGYWESAEEKDEEK